MNKKNKRNNIRTQHLGLAIYHPKKDMAYIIY